MTNLIHQRDGTKSNPNTTPLPFISQTAVEGSVTHRLCYNSKYTTAYSLLGAKPI